MYVAQRVTYTHNMYNCRQIELKRHQTSQVSLIVNNQSASKYMHMCASSPKQLQHVLSFVAIFYLGDYTTVDLAHMMLGTRPSY